jgi:hypothetical protein
MLSCTNNNKFVLEDEWEQKSIFLRGQIIGELDVDMSREIQIIDSLIVICDAYAEPVYKIYRMTGENKVERIAEFGTKGQGPNEFLFNMNMQMKGDTLSIFDKSLLRNYLIDCSSIVNNDISIVTENVKNASYFNQFIKLKDGLYIGNGIFEEGMFAFYHNDSKIDANIPYPNDGINAGNMQKGMVYQGCLAKQPKGNMLVYASFYGHIFEIYELISDSSIKKVFSDIYEYPLYDDSGGSPNQVIANFKEGNQTGFFDVSVTNEYVYALFCGEKDNEKDNDSANTIYVYNWKGEKIKKYFLDKNIVDMCIDSKNEKIYGLYNDPKDNILKVVCFYM